MPLRPARLPLWLALVAMLALALLPTLSHALTFARGGAAWAELCTPQGMRLVAVDAAQAAADTGAPAQAAGHLEHCPLCALGADLPMLPPAAPAALVLPLAAADAPALFLHAPRTLFAWRSAQPRGPPLFS
jgi:hypothetical protein